MDIYDFAMKKEKYAHDYYQQLAERSGHSGLTSIFSMLAEEEDKHYHVVEQMKSETPDTVTDTDVVGDAKNVFKKIREGTDKFDFDTSELDIYKKAQEIEQDSRNYYLEKAKEVQDQKQKDIFNTLANEERKHYMLLDNIIEMVSRPEQWLENPEWYHLEEY